jgi:hypothetical protein
VGGQPVLGSDTVNNSGFWGYSSGQFRREVGGLP